LWPEGDGKLVRVWPLSLRCDRPGLVQPAAERRPVGAARRRRAAETLVGESWWSWGGWGAMSPPVSARVVVGAVV